MKATLPLLVSTLALAACVPSAKAPPAPVPVARPAPAPTPTPTPAPAPVIQAPVSDNWMDAPATPGDWRYQSGAAGPLAVFIGAGGKGDFLLTCNRAGGKVDLWRAGTSLTPIAMTIRTETATRSLRAVQAEDTNPYLTAALDPRDPLLDAMALSKGRFAIEVDGLPTLYLPSWAEVTRVIEDCR